MVYWGLTPQQQPGSLRPPMCILFVCSESCLYRFVCIDWVGWRLACGIWGNNVIDIVIVFYGPLHNVLILRIKSLITLK